MKKPTERQVHEANVSFARATVAGPEMLAALLPIADRLRSHVSITLTRAEADAILAAIDKARNGIKIVT